MKVSERALTLAGVGVASLRRTPWQVVVEVLTRLAVQAFGVVVAHAVTVNLKTHLSVQSALSMFHTCFCLFVCFLFACWKAGAEPQDMG